MISVIITTYKRDLCILDRAIKSVIAQTMHDWELFVVDDNPADSPLRKEIQALIQEYAIKGRPIRYLTEGANKGACRARNIGLDAAVGNYVALLDDDDEWAPDKLEKQYNKLSSAGDDVVFVYCGFKIICDETATTRIPELPHWEGNIYDKLLEMNFIGGCSFPLIRMDPLREIGGFDEKMESSQDLDVWLRLAKKYKVAYIDEPLVYYHIHNGAQITKSSSKIISGRVRIINKNLGYFKEHPETFWIYLMTFSYDCAITGAYKESCKLWKKAFSLRPLYIYNNFIYLARILKACLTALKG